MSKPAARTGRIGITAALIAALSLTACGTSHTTSALQTGATAGRTSADAPAATRHVAGLTVTTIGGARVRVPSGKPSVLVFISLSCADCSAAAKAVAQASRTIGDKATFLAVDLDPGVPAQDLNDFLGSVHAKTLPTMIDAKFALSAKYKVSALSSVIVIDPAGKVTYRAVNPTASAITTAVAQSS